MHVVSTCPLQTASLVWQARPGAWVLTVVCKATYRMEPGVSPLAAEQEHPNDDDNHWDDDPQKSLYAPSDLAPFKTRADVLLVGYAFAPGGRPVPSLVARLAVGEIDKAIAVHGDRCWTLDGRVRDTGAVTRMGLRWERAAGGPDTANPVGVRPDIANASGEVGIPNLWPLGRIPQQRGEIVEPIGFGPIASTWPQRRDKLGPLARSFSLRELSRSALPLDIEPAFFNTAPRDQQLAELRSDERIVLENLHPKEPRLVTSLPGVAPRGFVERQGVAPLELTFRADTLWIDTDRGLITLAWRTQLPLLAAEEAGRVLIGMGHGATRPSWRDLAQAAARLQRASGAPSVSELGEAESLSEDDVRDAGDPMLPAVETLLVPPPRDTASTLFMTEEEDPAAQTLPFAVKSLSAPDVLRRAEQAAAAARGQDALPAGWGPPPPFKTSASARPEPVKEVAVASALVKVTDANKDAVRLGVLGLSDAAADAHRAVRRSEEDDADKEEERAPEPRPRPSEILKLLWFDPKVLPRLHKHPEWRILLAEMELRQLDEGDDDNDAGEDSKSRKSVFEVLSRGVPSPTESLRRLLSEAVDARGLFEAPLVLLTGDLEFAFDEVETLKATATVLTPLAPDKKIKEALDAASDFLKIPGADQFSRLAEGHTDRLKAAFAQVRQSLPVDYVETHTERALLRQRAYSMKALYGKRWIRALLRGAATGPGAGRGDGDGRGDAPRRDAARGDSGARGDAPPVYLPEALKDELPAYKRVRVKALGEVDLQEDQEEAAGWVVKITALARVISGL